MKTVLEGITKNDIRLDPFPHVLIPHAIPDDLAQVLTREYPVLEHLQKNAGEGSNKRFNFSRTDLKDIGFDSPTWQEFLTLHSSKEFFMQFVEVFREHLLTLEPSLSSFWNNSGSVRVGSTDSDSFETQDVLMSAYMAGSTPVTERAKPIKTAHIDNVYKPFTGLLYLRSDEDDSEGGNLELYRYRGKSVKFYGQRFIDDRFVEKVSEVPYNRGTLILFPNTPHAVHGVSVRSMTPHVRKFMNLSCDVREPYMNIDPYREHVFDKIRRRFRTDILARLMLK